MTWNSQAAAACYIETYSHAQKGSYLDPDCPRRWFLQEFNDAGLAQRLAQLYCLPDGGLAGPDGRLHQSTADRQGGQFRHYGGAAIDPDRAGQDCPDLAAVAGAVGFPPDAAR